MCTFSLAIQELQLISEIPTLRILILTNQPSRGLRIFKSQQSCEEYFPQLFASCSALQHIHVGINIDSPVPLYDRWSRGLSWAQCRNDIIEVKEVLLPEWNISSPFR